MPNKYEKIVEDTLDLHEYTRDEAQDEVLKFLEESKNSGYNMVRIIVGKGLHSENGPVLGDFVRNLLEENEYDFRNAKINQGSEGAIDISL